MKKQPCLKQPCRIVRKRTKGWRSLSGAVYVGRPTIWGNPYRHKDPRRAVTLFRHLLLGDPTHLPVEALKIRDQMHLELFALRGENLSCFCQIEAVCHADVLLGAANGEEIPLIEKGVNFAALLDRFKGGASVGELATRFVTSEAHIEAVVRWWMTSGDEAIPSREVWP